MILMLRLSVALCAALLLVAPTGAQRNRVFPVNSEAAAIKELTRQFNATVIRDNKAAGKPVVKVLVNHWLFSLNGHAAYLRWFKHLRELSLSRCVSKPDDLKQLAAFKELQTLKLAYCRSCDAGLRHLSGLKRLRVLDLEGSAVSDAGLRHLSAFKQLQELKLKNTFVTGTGAKELLALKQLRKLDLSKNKKVRDAGLKELAKLKQLRSLDIRGALVSEVALEELKRALPDCEIKGVGIPKGLLAGEIARADR